MKSTDALGNKIGAHEVERQEIVWWCTGSRLIPWADFTAQVAAHVAAIRPLAPHDPWQSLLLGEVKQWWVRHLRTTQEK
mgnify:CR=1 FL=1